MRILVVEDEERLARLISRVLSEEGYAVETEGNGRQALLKALADEFDLLIVDWMLPELSGVQLVKRLRAAEVGTPAIMLTARDQIEDRVEGLDAGADDYLPKPFAFPELLARVRALARRPWGEEKDGAILGAGDVTLDPVRHVVRLARSLRQRRRPLRLLPAQETRRRRRHIPHPNRPRCRLHLRAATRTTLMFDHIRRRLTVGYVGILALILLVFGVVVVLTVYLRASDQQDDLLLQKAEDKANSVLSGKDRDGVVKATTDYDVAVIVLLPDGSTYGDLDETSFSLGLPYTYMAQRAGQERQTIKETVPGPGGAVRVMSIPVKRYGEFGSVVAVVQAAQSREAVTETMERLIFVLVLTGFGALVLATAGGFFISRRAMRPVQEAFGRQRAFIADASHELKTPLTLIRADAEG